MINYHPKVRTKMLLLCLFLALSVAALLFLRQGLSPEEGRSDSDVFYPLTGLRAGQCVGTVDGERIPARLYLFYLACSCRHWAQQLSPQGDAPDWEAPFRDGLSAGDFLQQEAWSMLRLQILTEHLAQRQGLSLSPAAQQALDREEAEYIRRCGGEAELERALAQQGLDRACFDRLRRFGHLYRALLALAETPGSALYPSQEELLAFGRQEAYLSWDLLLLKSSDDQGQPLTEPARQARLQQLQALLYQLQRSPAPAQLFTQLAGLYSQDSRRILQPLGWTCPARQVPEIFSAARTLEENRCSPIIETADGWWLVFRRPLQTRELIAPYFSAALQRQSQCITWNSRLPRKLDLSAFYPAALALPGFPSE